jgi:TolB-like protein
MTGETVAPDRRALHSETADDRPQPSPSETRSQLERIVASPTFQASERRKALLRYLVEEALAGRADRLKGFAIAVAVFGRDETFDPQTDSIVRLEARRLRRDLDGYYVAAGNRDPVRISIPKGGYVPDFEQRDVAMARGAPPSGDARTYRKWLAIGLLAGVFFAVLGWLGAGLLESKSSWWSNGGESSATELPRGPKIAVLPFRSLSDDPEQAYFAQGITDQIITDLSRFRALFVLSMQSRANDQEHLADPQALRRELGIDYLLIGSVRRDEDHIKILARLIDAESGTIVWADSYGGEVTPSNVFAIQEDVSHQVSAILASHYGVIVEAGQTEAQHQPPTSLSAYDCVLRYYDHQRFLEPEEHARVRDCLERAVLVEPDYADAWAVLANVYAQEYRHHFNPRPELYDPRERSLAAAERAVDIEPRNPAAQLMLANALFDRRDLAGFKAAGERAIALNPNDPDSLAHYGMRLVFMGEWERGLALVTKAITLSPEFPEWYRSPRIFHYYQTGDYERALGESQAREVSGLWRLLFRAMILGQLGRTEEARPAIEAALALKPDVRERFWDLARVWNVPDPQIEQMADGLRKAGLAISPAPPAS